MPNLGRAYRAMVRRYQVEPDKVGFNDIVTAQQNLATALQSYLSALDAQWKAAVDVAAITQADDLALPPDAVGCAQRPSYRRRRRARRPSRNRRSSPSRPGRRKSSPIACFPGQNPGRSIYPGRQVLPGSPGPLNQGRA